MRKFKITAIALMFALLCACGIFVACSPKESHTHTIKFVERAATCTEQGLVAHYECVGEDGCGKFFADAGGTTEITIDDIEHTDALGHTGGDAKCNALAVCTRCEEEYGEFGEHDYTGGWVKDEQHHYVGCVNCGEIKEGEETFPHVYDEYVVYEQYLKSEATCQSKPVYHKTCVCGAFEEDGETFLYGEIGDHDFEWTSDETNHWKECKTAGCTAAHTDEGAHNFPAFVVTETGHYKECAACGRHTDEGDHSYTAQVEEEKFLIRASNCTQPGLYHKSCVCGEFEEDGATFETTAVGSHTYEWHSDGAQHWQICSVCSDETAKTAHSHKLAVRVKPGKTFTEDATVNAADYEVYNLCECGHETECNEAFTAVNTIYVRDENTIIVQLTSDNSKTAKVKVNATPLPRYTLTLVGANRNGDSEIQLKEGEKLPELTAQTGKTFAGYYYDDSFTVYYTELPAGYKDTHITVKKLSDFTMPARAFKLTAMLLENMPYVVPSDYQDSDGTKAKVASHVEVDGKIVTRFEWNTTEKGKIYKVRPNNDTKSHHVNVANPAVNPNVGDKSLMLVGITNNGTEAVTVNYKTENWGDKGNMTVTVGANSTVIVPFVYNFYHMVNGTNRGTCWNCDQWIAVTSEMTTKAQLDVFGYLVADGYTKPVRLDAPTAVMVEQGAQTAWLTGKLVVDLSQGISLDVYNEVNVSAVPEAHGCKYPTLSACGYEKTVPMFIKDAQSVAHSADNLFTLAPVCYENDVKADWITAELVDVDNAVKATKFTFLKNAAAGKTAVTKPDDFVAGASGHDYTSEGYNFRAPAYKGVGREIELHVINNSDVEMKLYICGENWGYRGGVEFTLKRSSEESGEQVFKFTYNDANRETYGCNYEITTKGEIAAGASFTVYGWYKGLAQDSVGKTINIVNSSHKTSFDVGDKFDSDKLRLRYTMNSSYDKPDKLPNIVNYVTDYDGYTFTESDVGEHTVFVYWNGLSTTYKITVS